MLRYIIALLIVYVPNQLHFPTSTGITGINVFNVLLFVSLLVVFGSAGKPEIGAPLKGRILLYMGVLIYGFLLASGRSLHPFEDFVALKTALTYPLLFFIVYNATPDLKTARIYIGVLLFVLLLMSVEICREMLTVGFGTNRRFAGPFGHGEGNANYAGTYLAIFAPLAASIAIFYKDNAKVRLVAAGVAALAVFANFYTFSRASLLAITISFVLLAAIRSRLLMVVMLAAIVNYAIWAPEGVQKRVDETTVQTEMGEEILEESAESRFLIWGAAGEMMRGNPLGIGFNQFKDRIEPYMPPQVIARDAHNHFVLVAAEVSILGLIVFIWLWIGLIGTGFRLVRAGADNETRAIAFGYLAGLIGLLIGNFFNSLFYSGELMGNFWILTAIVIRYTQLKQESPDESSAANPAPPPVHPGPSIPAR